MPASGPAPAAAVVLAAGKGSRMRSRYPKAAHRLLGKPLARYPIDLCRRLGIERVLVVVGHQAEAVRDALGEDLEYVEQPEQRGTGDALRCAAPALGECDGPVLVLQADCVLLRDDDVAALIERQRDRGGASLLTALVEEPGAYGRILRGPDGAVRRIVEAKGASPEVLSVREINVGVYVFSASELSGALRDLQPDLVSGELYLTALVEGLAEHGVAVEAVPADPVTAQGVNDRVELARCGAVLRERILRAHMLNGVTVEDPQTTYIDADVRIGRDTIIRPLSFLCGATVIGEECEIGPSVRITDATLADRVTVQSSVIAESVVGEGTRIGPFAQLRPGCRIGRKVKIGNFVELKNAEVEDGASMGHLAYIGDAFVGEKSNIGAGTITCNYDGKRKHHTRIGRNAFVGTHATLVAPVEIGDGAFVAAATAVTEDVPPDALVVGRVRPTVKPDWARRRRERAA